jgi:tetratricopeptide (TPR) repeat protein
LELAGGLQTEAIRELRALLGELPGHLRPERARTQRFLALALTLAGRPEEAQRELEKLLEVYPGDADGTLALAELHLDAGRAAQAIELLAALTEQHGRLTRAHLLLGRAQLEAGSSQGAEQSFRRLWELAPHQPEARYWLSMALQEHGQAEQARRLLEGNLKRFPGHESSLSALTQLIEKSEGRRAARSFVLGHGQQHPDSASVAIFEARFLMEQDDAERALVAYRRALAADPSAFAAVRDLARFYARRQKRALAQSVLDGALAHDPRNPSLFLLAASIESDLGQPNQARDHAERALALSPGHPLALARLAELQAEAFKNLAAARTLAGQAYESAPGHAQVNAALGWVTHLGGDSLQALPYLERAAQFDPDDPHILYRLGASLLSAGRQADARQKLARVLELDPLFPTRFT